MFRLFIKPFSGCNLKRTIQLAMSSRYEISFTFLDYYNILECGAGSSVGIATDQVLDGPGSNLGEDEIFRTSRPAVAPTRSPVKWVPCLSRGKVRPGRAADHSPPSSAAVMKE